MPGPKPTITAEQTAELARLHAEGRGRNETARMLGLSELIVSKAAKRLGLDYGPTAPLKAQATYSARAAAARAKLEAEMAETALRLTREIFKPTTYTMYGGKDFIQRQYEAEEPTHQDKQRLAQAAYSASAASLRIRDTLDGGRTEEAKSMLTDLFKGLAAVAKDPAVDGLRAEPATDESPEPETPA